MKFVDEFRDAGAVKALAAAINTRVHGSWTIMEICGGQTHNVLQFGIDRMLPPGVQLVHGPGCPVCVTPLELIDQAIAIASRPRTVLTSFGDMLRVPGSVTDLLTVKASGGDVRIVYSPLDAVQLARQNPDREVVFFAVGFETTVPASAMAAWQARQSGLKNFSLLSAHVLVPPAIQAILSAPANRIQAFLAAGHVCTVMGYHQYEPLAEKFRVPLVVTGFEPVDLLTGILGAVEALEEGRHGVDNRYSRAVTREGNLTAQDLITRVYEPCDRRWRGIGVIPRSGLRLKAEFGDFDAAFRFGTAHISVDEPAVCIAGEVLQGHKKPVECPAFGTQCTPDHPLGAPMVSAEGACAAYFHYRRT